MKANRIIHNIIKAIFIIIFCISFILVTGQSENIKSQMLWTLGWAVVMALSAYGIDRMMKKEK